MKKIILLVVATIFSFAIVEANETTIATTNSTNTEITAEAPAYWSGWADKKAVGPTDSAKLYITVYRSANMCDSFYAVATQYVTSYWDGSNKKSYDINEELIVRESSKGKYYVSYKGANFYFYM